MRFNQFGMHVFSAVFILCAFLSASAEDNYPLESLSRLQDRLQSYISDKDARIGVALIINGTDTVAVNGKAEFPMLSVYKFPQALAVAEYCESKNISVKDSVSIRSAEILADTWSPLRDKYGCKDLTLPLEDLLAFSLQQSDNNACDILFRLIGGPEKVDLLMKKIGFNNILVCNTEAEMHDDIYLSYANRTTPIDMASLFDKFYRQGLHTESPVYEKIGELMISCETGMNRLVAPVRNKNLKIGHKTGTGDKNSQGRWIGINDAGYVFISDQEGYAIAVFVADSAYDMAHTEKLIADISEIVLSELCR